MSLSTVIICVVVFAFLEMISDAIARRDKYNGRR